MAQLQLGRCKHLSTTLEPPELPAEVVKQGMPARSAPSGRLPGNLCLTQAWSPPGRWSSRPRLVISPLVAYFKISKWGFWCFLMDGVGTPPGFKSARLSTLEHSMVPRGLP